MKRVSRATTLGLQKQMKYALLIFMEDLRVESHRDGSGVADDGMVDVLWEKRLLAMFEVDLTARSTEITAHARADSAFLTFRIEGAPDRAPPLVLRTFSLGRVS